MSSDRDRQLAGAIASKTTPEEQDVLTRWVQDLLAIRASPGSTVFKARQAVARTVSSPVVVAAAKVMIRELKHHGWESRSWAGRFGLTGAAIGIAVFGGQGAGIAALGTAIGVPLWIVVGSGAAFAGVLVEEFIRQRP